jgi:hypothetical protein
MLKDFCYEKSRMRFLNKLAETLIREGITMKKISRTAAMILLLVILASSFTSCLTYWNYKETNGDPFRDPLKAVLFGVVDLIFLPFSLVALVIYLIVSDNTSVEMESYQMHLTNADYNFFMDYNSLRDLIYSLSEDELASLTQALSSIPEAQLISLLQAYNSLSETQRVSLADACNFLPETERISSISKINSLSETELVSLLHTFNSLTETELDFYIEELESLREIEYAVVTKYSLEKAPPASMRTARVQTKR